MSLKEIFTTIYFRDIWRGAESRSGKGSDSIRTQDLKVELVRLFEKYDVKTIVDAPCGDFNWMKNVVADSKWNYVGYDIVEEMVAANNMKHGDVKRSFHTMDVTVGPLVKGDILLCRDCLVHLSYLHIKDFFECFLKSKTEYLLTTTFTKDNRVNCELKEGLTGWRPLSFAKEPFNFPTPVELIQETHVEHPDFTDKSLGMWHRDTIKKYMEDSNVASKIDS